MVSRIAFQSFYTQLLLILTFIIGLSCFLFAEGKAPSDQLPPSSGFSVGLRIEEPQSSLWKHAASDIGEGIAYQGHVYLITDANEITALNAASGEQVWQTTLPTERAIGLAHSAEQGLDFIAVSHKSGLALLDRYTGAILWDRPVAEGLAAPVIFKERIFAAGNDGWVYAFDLHNGEELWNHDFVVDAPDDPPGFDGASARFGDQPARPRPIATDGETLFFCVFDQCRVIAVDLKTGQRRWAFQTKGWMFCRPAVTAKYVLVGSQDKHFYCIDKRTGQEVWKFKTNSRVEAAPASDGKRVFAGSCDANLYCCDIETGELLWKRATQKRKKYGGPIYEQAFLASEIVYLPTMEGQVYAFNKSDGQVNWQFRPSENSEIDLSFTDGKRLFVGTRLNIKNEGEQAVFAFGAKSNEDQ